MLLQDYFVERGNLWCLFWSCMAWNGVQLHLIAFSDQTTHHTFPTSDIYYAIIDGSFLHFLGPPHAFLICSI